MASKKKKIVLEKKIENWARFSKLFGGFFAFLAKLRDFLYNPANQIQLKIDPNAKPLPSYFDMIMTWICHTCFNGFFIWFVIYFLTPYQISIALVFPIGVARFLALDLMEEFIYKPATRVSRAFGASAPKR
ncbi:MAG: hypothetical protein WC451_02735 [Patescibacteria group bacterium]